jgi:hypothetical protein
MIVRTKNMMTALSAGPPTAQQIAAILRRAPYSQPWALEGPCRHRVRAMLLDVGWTASWHKADREARRLVARGRSINGVACPRGWDDNGLAALMGSADCPICGKAVRWRGS